MREFIINIVLFCFTFQRVFSKNPHIIFILADDLGWNDVGFHGSNQIPTPNIDALAYTGIILNNYYVTPICTPSRSALLTGKYPIHLGLQHGVIHGSTPYGLSLKETILPQHLKIAGYATRLVGKWHLGMQHRVIYESEPWGLGLDDIILPQYLKKVGYATSIVGKWHLGHFKKLYLPESRGFDSHYGYWTGRQDYYDHTAVGKHGYKGYDMRRGMNVTWNDNNTYTTDLLTNEAVKIIKNHPREKPLFLYISHLATHSGNPDRPLQAPQDVIDKFKYIKDKNRRIFAAMLWKMDESIGLVVSALAKSKMLENSVIVFSTDNGGPADGFNFNAASNWPLRGVKDTLWEGGVRGAGFVWCPFLPSSVVSNAMIHITDWLPTLLSLTTYPSTIDGIDGVNVWDSLDKNNPSPRDEILLNIDNERNVSALRYKNWKYKKGNTGTWNHWYGPSGRNTTYNWTELYNCKVTKAIKHLRKLPKKASINQIRSAATVICNGQPKEETGIASDNLSSSIYLYDLNTDPCEMRNLVSKQPNLVQLMEHKLKTYQETTVPPRNKPSDPRSNPIYWNNTWTNWMDYL